MTKEHLIDLDKEQLGLLEQILKRHIPDKTVWAYGSRVTWKADERSDLDLAVFDCDLTETGTLKDALEESNLLVSVDVMNWESIPENFKENIREKYVVLQEKTKLEGWRDVRLGEIASEIKSGGTPLTKQAEYYGGNIPWLNTKEVDFNRIFDTETKITEYGFENSSAQWVKENSVVVAMYGATAGKIALTKIPLTTNQACCNLTLDENQANYSYIYYNLFSRYSELVKLSSGAAQQNLNVGFITNLVVFLPPLHEQKAIAKVLSSLDDKIDLLHRQNKTLEDMAQALFRKWFIEEAKEDWEEKPLDEVFDFLEGPGIRNWQYREEGTRFINIRLIQDGEIRIENSNFVSDEEANGKYKHFLLQEKDMIVSTSGTLGKTAVIKSYHLPLMLNTSVICFRPKDNRNYSFMYQYLQSRAFREDLEAFAGGSVQKNFGPTHLKLMKVKNPPQTLLEKFADSADLFYEKINVNYSQIHTLGNLRDTLLPKLMSGAVRLNF